MAVDKVIGTRIFCGFVLNTEVELTAIVWVRKISV
jgi:hypothetical protein